MLLGACTSQPAPPEATPAQQTTAPRPPATSSPDGTTAASPRSTPATDAHGDARPDRGASEAPAWLGTRVLEPGPTGFPPPQPTPAELFPRSLDTPDRLPPPDRDDFVATVASVPDEVLERSTWHAGCPVDDVDLRHLTVSFVGFDGGHHTGEVLVHHDAVDAVVAIFEELHATAFPIEDVAIITPELLEAPATGDGNITSAFVCRDSRGGGWSEHAYGRALDINPFHNPYVRDDDGGRVVLPELATAYTDRTLALPGMLAADHPVIDVIEQVGWYWGGHYQSVSDPMHVSATGR